MPEALKTKDIPKGASQSKKSSNEKRRALSGKTFEELTKNQKDDLLKQVAVSLGILKDSDD